MKLKNVMSKCYFGNPKCDFNDLGAKQTIKMLNWVCNGDTPCIPRFFPFVWGNIHIYKLYCIFNTMVADDLTMHRAVRKHAIDIVILKYYGLSPKERIEKTVDTHQDFLWLRTQLNALLHWFHQWFSTTWFQNLKSLNPWVNARKV